MLFCKAFTLVSERPPCHLCGMVRVYVCACVCVFVCVGVGVCVDVPVSAMCVTHTVLCIMCVCNHYSVCNHRCTYNFRHTSLGR